MAGELNALWGRIVADELAKAGVDTAVLCPGSRSTPLTVAFVEHPGIDAVSHLDERSAAFFALGHAKRTGTPAPVVCTSGTALANLHPAVVEADAARVPMVLLTADRPPELADSGANQTIDQEKFYGDSARSYRKLPEPEAADRKLRALRVALSRAVATATGTEPGPVHLDVPLRKPLEPNAGTGAAPKGVPDGSLPEGFDASDRPAATGRDGPFVEVTRGRSGLSAPDRERIATAVEGARSGLIVCGPADGGPDPGALAALAEATGFPVFADPLSGHRFGPHTRRYVACGGYDGYVGALDADPEVVVRFGASPTSKPLRGYLRDSGAEQFVVDPAGGWREATFTATDLVVADGTQFASELAGAVDRDPGRTRRRSRSSRRRTGRSSTARSPRRVPSLPTRSGSPPIRRRFSSRTRCRSVTSIGSPGPGRRRFRCSATAAPPGSTGSPRRRSGPATGSTSRSSWWSATSPTTTT